MTVNFAPTKIFTKEHVCYYLIEVSGGRLIAVCRGCGKWLEYDEILKRINAKKAP